MITPMLALLDGSIVDMATPIIRADDLGVVRGDGVFDATLVRRGIVRDLDDHLARFSRSSATLELPDPDHAGYRRALDALIAAWDWDAAPEAVARFVLTRGAETFAPAERQPSSFVMLLPVAAATIAERTSGVRVLLLPRGHDGDDIAGLPWLHPGAKTLSYSINMAAKRYATSHDADDVVFVSSSGHLLEGPTSTLLVDIDGVLVTPPQLGILDSITLAQVQRDAPREGLRIAFRALDADALHGSRGAWLLSSGRLAAAISSVDGKPLATSPLHEALYRVIGV